MRLYHTLTQSCCKGLRRTAPAITQYPMLIKVVTIKDNCLRIILNKIDKMYEITQVFVAAGNVELKLNI